MMKTMSRMLLAALLLASIFMICSIFFAYEAQDDMAGFPVPKNAVLTKTGDSIAVYEWPTASEENGIPFFYELALQSKGWELAGREGASSYYEKGGSRIDLISQTGLLTVRVEQ